MTGLTIYSGATQAEHHCDPSADDPLMDLRGPVEMPLALMPDESLVSRTQAALNTALGSGCYQDVRACEDEARRRNKLHLYDRGYSEFWLSIFHQPPALAGRAHPGNLRGNTSWPDREPARLALAGCV